MNFTEQSFEQKFLIGLLILNFVFWVRLLWRIHISCRYNKIYYDSVKCDVESVECDVKRKKYAEEYIQNTYEKNMRCFNSHEKWEIGLGIPLALGLVAITCLSLRLPLPFPCSEIILFFGLLALDFAIATLTCEYRREIELQEFLEDVLVQNQNNSQQEK